MTIINYILLCAFLGGIYWLIFMWAFPQIDATIKKLALIAIVVLLVLVLMSAMGLIGMGDVQIPRVR